MERQPVKSSNVKSIGHDAETSVLEVEFHSGGVYRYSSVSQEEYDALMKADSIGSAVNAFRARHSFRKVI